MFNECTVQQLSTVFKTIFKHSTVVLLTAFAYIPSMICHTVYCTVMYFAGLQHKNPELDYVMILLSALSIISDSTFGFFTFSTSKLRRFCLKCGISFLWFLVSKTFVTNFNVLRTEEMCLMSSSPSIFLRPSL